MIYDLSITTADLVSFHPCFYGVELESLLAFSRTKDRWTARDILSCNQYRSVDRLWLVLRPQLIAERDLHVLSCLFAEQSLDCVAARGITVDTRSRLAITAKRDWLDGKITDQAMVAARAAARDAWRAAWAAASAAANAAARTTWAAARIAWTASDIARAASDAAWTAASDAAWTAASDAARVASHTAWIASDAANAASDMQVRLVVGYLDERTPSN